MLKGATALALPLKLGQSMKVEILDSSEEKIYWKAFQQSDVGSLMSAEYQESKPWFSVVLEKKDFSIIDTDDKEKAERLSDILLKIKSLNGDIFNYPHDYKFTTHIDFDPQWGLGSSSTLINNVSEWAKIDPYQLLDSTFKGSGYDIACAKAERPIFYQLNRQQTTDNRLICTADFNPDFKDNIYFVYQGHKQNSANEVKAFLDKNKNYDKEVMMISEISKMICHAKSLDSFCNLIKYHEEIMESVLNRKGVKSYYPDFEGEMKSLGAWGGDFFLAATEWNDEQVKRYFENKGLDVIIKYDNIVKN